MSTDLRKDSFAPDNTEFARSVAACVRISDMEGGRFTLSHRTCRTGTPTAVLAFKEKVVVDLNDSCGFS
jgi:hypothetical protein